MSWSSFFVGALMLGAVTNDISAEPMSHIDTSSWKPYRNEAMGFEVKYPNSWHASSAKGTVPENVSLSEPFQTADKPRLSVQLWVQRRMNPKSLSIEQWYANHLQGIKAPPPTTAHTAIGGMPAIRMEVVTTSDIHYSFFIALNKLDILTITIIQPLSEKQLNKTYEALLSSIKLIS